MNSAAGMTNNQPYRLIFFVSVVFAMMPFPSSVLNHTTPIPPVYSGIGADVS